MSTSLLRDQTSALKQLFPALTAAAMLLAAGSTRAATTVISDGTFTPGNWALQIGPKTTPGITAGYNQVTSGGDPGSYLAVNYGPTGTANVDLNMMTYFTGQSYSPQSQGPISSISFSADLINLTGQNIVFFGLFQDNTAYLLQESPGAQLTSSWTSFLDTGSTPNNFLSEDYLTHPNLLNGDPIEFGIVTSEASFGGFFAGSYGIDNFQATITSSPEPRGWALGAFGILAFALSKRMSRPGTKGESLKR